LTNNALRAAKRNQLDGVKGREKTGSSNLSPPLVGSFCICLLPQWVVFVSTRNFHSEDFILVRTHKGADIGDVLPVCNFSTRIDAPWIIAVAK
jgi:hypothetical protein